MRRKRAIWGTRHEQTKRNLVHSIRITCGIRAFAQPGAHRGGYAIGPDHRQAKDQVWLPAMCRKD